MLVRGATGGKTSYPLVKELQYFAYAINVFMLTHNLGFWFSKRQLGKLLCWWFMSCEPLAQIPITSMLWKIGFPISRGEIYHVAVAVQSVGSGFIKFDWVQLLMIPEVTAKLSILSLNIQGKGVTSSVWIWSHYLLIKSPGDIVM